MSKAATIAAKAPMPALTDEDLLRLPKDGNKYELVDGELRLSPAGWVHERVIMRLAARLQAFVEERSLGDVLGSSALFILPSGNRRGPDVSFVAAGRLPPSTEATPFPALAPDLAVEVLSPGDRPREVLDKIGEYLQAGVRLVWVIDPVARKATAYRSLTAVAVVDESGELAGADVLPGFRCPLASVLGSEA